MAATIRDVARVAGVSIATVSRTLRDPAQVTSASRERVEQAVAELAFVPSQLGRQLAERRHAANGIVFPDLSGPYFAEVVLGYESVAAELGRSVLILSTHGREGTAASLAGLAGRCDGLVVLGRTVPDDDLRRLADGGMPLVLIARTPLPGIDAVASESEHSARELAAHLAAAGARRVAFVGDPEQSTDIGLRLAGLREGAARHDMQVDVVRPAELDERSGVLVADALDLAALPDAIACANDELALGLTTRLRDRGVRVPDDVLVSGWDDVMAARFAGLTTVRQPMRELGARAARMLDERIRGLRDEARHDVLPTSLVVRDSTRPTGR